MPSCEFDRLFKISVPHILEKVFFSLDYDTLMACNQVCKCWNSLISSKSYQRRANELLGKKRENERKLCEYTFEGKVEQVQQLLFSRVDPNCEGVLCNGGNPQTPLFYASTNGRKDVAIHKLLLNAGAEPNKADDFGQTPLDRAAFWGNKDVVHLLLYVGADPNKANIFGETPLEQASIGGKPDVVKLLLDAGADPNKANNDERTPLYWASTYGHKEVVEMLLNRGADIKIASKQIKRLGNITPRSRSRSKKMAIGRKRRT